MKSAGRADSTEMSSQARFYQVTFRPADEHQGTSRVRGRRQTKLKARDRWKYGSGLCEKAPRCSSWQPCPLQWALLEMEVRRSRGYPQHPQRLHPLLPHPHPPATATTYPHRQGSSQWKLPPKTRRSREQRRRSLPGCYQQRATRTSGSDLEATPCLQGIKFCPRPHRSRRPTT